MERSIFYFEYPVAGGTAAPFVQDRIFFRFDGIVDWIEGVVADRDGKFHPAQETLDQVGYTLDTAYMNNNVLPPGTPQYDVMHGPAQVYVWSECGLALLVLGTCSPADSTGLKCIPIKSIFSGESFPSAVVLRHPNPYLDAEPILLGADNAVLIKFLFPPTSYEGFTKFYMHRIPYLPWDIFTRDVPIESP